VVYSICIPPKNLGDPGSSRGTLERIRVGLTLCSPPGWESIPGLLKRFKNSGSGPFFTVSFCVQIDE
jgi:hypothetical protein